MPDNRSKLPSDGDVSARTLIFGCGYLGESVAKKARNLGDQVWATTRNPEKRARLAVSEGIQIVSANWTEPASLGQLPPAERMLVSVSYDRNSGQSRQESIVGGLSNLLQVISPTTHLCYVSTTGVYHQADGSWVDEESPAQPTRESGLAHLQAEELLRQRTDLRWTILRLSGIYGPGRLPRAADVVAGRPIAAAQDGFLNLIHLEDASDAILAAWSKSQQGLFLVSDGCPVRRGDFYREVARQTDAPLPTFVEPRSGTDTPTRSESNKRVRNDRMRRDLVPHLTYPTYRHGLAAML